MTEAPPAPSGVRQFVSVPIKELKLEEEGNNGKRLNEFCSVPIRN